MKLIKNILSFTINQPEIAKMKVKGWTRFGGFDFGPKYILAIKIYSMITKK